MTAGKTDRKTGIKICGLSRMEDIGYVNEARPDYCGFVIGVPASRRNVTVTQLARLRQRLSEQICPVGVFVNAVPELIAELLNDGVIDAAQLHGSEDETYIARLRDMTDKPLIKAFSIQNLSDLEEAEKSSADLVLLDHGKAAPGQPLTGNFSGTGRKGRTFWQAALTPEISRKRSESIIPMQWI